MDGRRRIVCVIGFGSLLLCGASSPTGCQNSNAGSIGPSTGEVVGAAIGVVAVVAVGTVVLVEVHNSHHIIKGCVTTGPDGLTVHTPNNGKIYALTGVTANVKVGDVIKVHGSKPKGQKDSSGDQDFAVERMSRDYGPCKAEFPSPLTAAQQ